MQGFSKGGAVLSSELKVTVKGGNLEAQALQSAMRSGTRDCLPLPQTPPMLLAEFAVSLRFE